jgi:hypothetical protein
MRITTEQAYAMFDAFEAAGLLVDPDGSWRKHFFMEVSVLGHKRWNRGPWTLMNEWAKKPPRLIREPLGAESTPEREAAEAERLEWVNVDILRIMKGSLPVPPEMKNFKRVPQATLDVQTDEQWEALFDRIEQEGPIVITDPSRDDVVLLPAKWFHERFGVDLNDYFDNRSPEERESCYAEQESSTESPQSSS